MLRRRFVSLLAASAGALCGGCAGPAPKSETIPLRVSSLPRISMGPLHLARELGYFLEQGLDVTIRQIRFSYEVTALLAGGQIDISCLGLSPGLLNVVAKGAQLRLVVCRGIFSPQCPLFGTVYGNRKVFPEGLTDLRRLRDKRVCIRGKGNNSEFYLDILLGSAGMSSSDVQAIALPEPDGVAALVSGKVDAMVSSDMEARMGTISPEIIQGPGVADVLPNLQHAFVALGPTILEGDPEIGIRFVTAYLRGAEDFRNGKTPKFVDDLAKVTRMDPELLRESCRETWVPDGDMDSQSLGIYRDWAVRKGYSPENTPIDNLIDTNYLEEARKRLGKISGEAAPQGTILARSSCG